MTNQSEKQQKHIKILLEKSHAKIMKKHEKWSQKGSKIHEKSGKKSIQKSMRKKMETKSKRIDFLTPLQVPIDYVYEADYLQKTYLTEKLQTIGLRDRLLERKVV